MKNMWILSDDFNFMLSKYDVKRRCTCLFKYKLRNIEYGQINHNNYYNTINYAVSIKRPYHMVQWQHFECYNYGLGLSIDLF